VKYHRASLHVICNYPRCRRITTGKYCEEHSYKPPERKAGRDKFLDTAAWRKLSKLKLNETPWCELCMAEGKTKPAIDVDHIKSREDHPNLSLDYANLQSLCGACHCVKTRRGD